MKIEIYPPIEIPKRQELDFKSTTVFEYAICCELLDGLSSAPIGSGLIFTANAKALLVELLEKHRHGLHRGVLTLQDGRVRSIRSGNAAPDPAETG